MSQLLHISKNKIILEQRAQITKEIRGFFWSRGFMEVETPNLVKLPGQEPYLSPMNIKLHNELGAEFEGYLHTSPEYTLKKMLAAGFGDIFSICKTYRDFESFGDNHNPEFTMLEWYRVNVDFCALMDDVELLLQHLHPLIPNSPLKNLRVERVQMKDLWQEYVNVNLDNYLEKENMAALCTDMGYNIEEDEAYENLFYRIFLNEIEPRLAERGVVIVHHYPARMAALARLSKEDPRYAERFEVYVRGIELANAFSELTDPGEQRKRLEEERELGKKMGKDVYDVDEEFIEAVGKMPECAGIALGVDRLVQVLTGCKNINDVLVLPASLGFKSLHN